MALVLWLAASDHGPGWLDSARRDCDGCFLLFSYAALPIGFVVGYLSLAVRSIFWSITPIGVALAVHGPRRDVARVGCAGSELLDAKRPEPPEATSYYRQFLEECRPWIRTPADRRLRTRRGTLRGVGGRAGADLAGEFIQFLRHSKKWWLTPILLVLGAGRLDRRLGRNCSGPLDLLRCSKSSD